MRVIPHLYFKGLEVVADFENTLYTELSRLDYNRFKVNLEKRHIFVCGGTIDPLSPVPKSFRDYFLNHTATENHDIHDAIVLAESFKDYFKENTFNDLLIFEDEIANIATLVLIFLESPGSLVELGMFCSKPAYYKKLLVVAAQDKTEDEDSFIYLGPLVHIKKKEPSSVAIYPWPKENVTYDKAYLDDLTASVQDKLDSVAKQVSFNKGNSGHVALLVYEIIRLSYPILIGEIEIALAALDLKVEEIEVKRHIYLLSKLGLINHNFYSSYTYYYPLLKDLKTISFGKDKYDKIPDSQSIQMNISQSYVVADSIQAKKRVAAKKQINGKLKEVAK